MQKVKIVATTHPRLNAGFVYYRVDVPELGTRFTSLGGKHSVFVTIGHPSTTRWEPVVSVSPADAPRPPERGFHNEPHVRIGERIAADLWNKEYTDHSKYNDPEGCTVAADKAAQAFLKRWKEGFFRGEAQA